jgi:hypothetical protein
MLTDGLTNAADLLEANVAGSADVAANLRDFAADVLQDRLPTFEGVDEIVRPDSAAILMTIADEAQMLVAEVREPGISLSIETDIAGLKNFVLRYPVRNDEAGLSFEKS